MFLAEGSIRKGFLERGMKFLRTIILGLVLTQFTPAQFLLAERARKTTGVVRKTAVKKPVRWARPKALARGPLFHRVRKGETLATIARRYRITVGQLKTWNRLGRTYNVRAGLALKVGAGAAPAVRKWQEPPIPVGNRWLNTSAHTRVLTPFSYSIAEPYEKVYNGDDYGLRIYAEKFAQGRAGYVEVRAPSAKGFGGAETVALKFHDEKIPLTRATWGYRGIFAIPPNRKPGNYQLSVIHNSGKQELTRHFSIQVDSTYYPLFTRTVYLGRAENFPPPNPAIEELIRVGRLKKDQVFAINSANKLTSNLSHPRDLHRVTSPFYTQRKTIQWYHEGGQKIVKPPIVRPHNGLDLRARVGEPILAMADGRVVCAMRMHMEGNFTIIDHGNQVFTGYMHQSRFNVREGDYVRAGQKIGEAGNTGASTGPHLHIALWIRGVPVEPLSLLALPVR